MCSGLICREQLQCQGHVIPRAPLPSATHWATHSTWATPVRDGNVAGANVPRHTHTHTHIIHVQTHRTNTHTRQIISHMPILQACSSSAQKSAANSVPSFKSLPKDLIRSFSSVGRIPAPTLVNHPDEPSVLKQPEAEVSIKPPQTIREQMASSQPIYN